MGEEPDRRIPDARRSGEIPSRSAEPSTELAKVSVERLQCIVRDSAQNGHNLPQSRRPAWQRFIFSVRYVTALAALAVYDGNDRFETENPCAFVKTCVIRDKVESSPVGLRFNNLSALPFCRLRGAE